MSQKKAFPQKSAYFVLFCALSKKLRQALVCCLASGYELLLPALVLLCSFWLVGSTYIATSHSSLFLVLLVILWRWDVIPCQWSHRCLLHLCRTKARGLLCHCSCLFHSGLPHHCFLSILLSSGIFWTLAKVTLADPGRSKNGEGCPSPISRTILVKVHCVSVVCIEKMSHINQY